MPTIYGPLLSVRILEEISFWKEQETEHTLLIQATIPGLEEGFAKLLNEWKDVFTSTHQTANQLLQYAMTSKEAANDSQLIRETEKLMNVSFQQSTEFISQLYYILDQSNAAKSHPSVKTIMLHIIRESKYFLEKDSSPRNQDSPVPIGGHTLPPLPYAYDALEPYIDEQTMRIHHDKHHQVYVDDLNKAEIKLQEARQSGNFDLVKHWERELAFNGAGHYLHTIFWDIMNPTGGGMPDGALLEQIKQDFGSYDAFHKQFSSAAEKVEGGGWAVLVWSPRSHRLEILTAEKHQNLSQWDIVPLLPLDVWEHAYYLKHQNRRKDYIQDWWNVVYWPEVAARFEQARTLKWQPY